MFLFISGVKGKRQLRKRLSRHSRTDCQGKMTTEEPWSDQHAEETTMSDQHAEETTMSDQHAEETTMSDQHAEETTMSDQHAEETTTEEPWSDENTEETFTAEPWSDQQYCPDIKFDVKASRGHAIIRKTMSNTYVYKTRYTCNLCGRKFPFKCKLEEHQRIHTGQKPFVCTICSNTFTQKSSLTRHYVKIHRVPPVADFKYLK